MQYCTSLLFAEVIICRLHYYFSEGTHGLQHCSITFHYISGKYSLLLMIDVQASYIPYYFFIPLFKSTELALPSFLK